MKSEIQFLGKEIKENKIWEFIRKKRQAIMFVEKTKTNNNVKNANLSHRTKQGNSNSNTVTEMGDSISTNTRGYKDKRKYNLICQW